GDDDLDAVSASREDNKLAWFDNDGFLGFGNEAIVDTNAEFANAVAAGDLDGDDDLDLALGAYTGDEVTRFLNDGLGGFDDGLTVNSIAFGVIQVALADFDNDGDLDVVSANQGATGVAWYPNDGDGSFGIGAGNEITITSSTVNVEPLVVADFDQDGDSDVAVGDWGADQVTRFVNDGAGGFGEGVVVATLGGDVEGLDAGDVDGDGDLDLVACSWDDNALVWMENLGAVGVNDERGERPAAFALGEAFPNPFNPAVTIRYQIAEPAFVRLAIFDALGKHVETLVQRSRTPGSYDVRFNAAHLPSGAYFYELNARAESGRTFREAKKMIYLK
ncbi:MAG: T9SS type A sorting domain-containing protein, partial [Ignavibacteriales bacterium]|nr:T9SS type A sorting domain-containing protein [Ignavibacteriales bacterium]